VVERLTTAMFLGEVGVAAAPAAAFLAVGVEVVVVVVVVFIVEDVSLVVGDVEVEVERCCKLRGTIAESGEDSLSCCLLGDGTAAAAPSTSVESLFEADDAVDSVLDLAEMGGVSV